MPGWLDWLRGAPPATPVESSGEWMRELLSAPQVNADVSAPDFWGTLLQAAGAAVPKVSSSPDLWALISPRVPPKPSVPMAVASTPPGGIGGNTAGATPGVPVAYAAQVARAATEFGVDPALVAAIIHQESNWNPQARNPSGASGLGQFMPDTARGLRLDPFNPDQAIRGVAQYYRQLLDQFGGNELHALAAYNAGPGNVQRYNGVPPFAETQKYVTAIPRLREMYRAQAQAVEGVPRLAPTVAAGMAARTEAVTPTAIRTNGLNQFEMGLPRAVAEAICGPAAAEWFANTFNGRAPNIAETLEMAKQQGWTQGAGMAGPDSQVALLRQMGVPVQLERTVDWAKVAREVQAGRPVIIDTPGHYYQVVGYDSASQTFDFGGSVLALASSQGRRWFRPQDLPALGMGAARSAIYLAE